MASPRDLGGRIDELQLAVDAARETADARFAVECEVDAPSTTPEQRREGLGSALVSLAHDDAQ